MFPTPTPDSNIIHYRVFFRRPEARAAAANAHAASPDDGEADRVFAASRRAAYAEFVGRQVGDFIWHKHAMHFSIAEAADETASPLLRTFFLEGETAVGDAIDDEWVVTWLLFLLTTEFPDDDAIVQVNDTDGEFLLIECADVLPEWVSPENSANRVFVRRGEVHLVSVDVVPELEGLSLAAQELHAGGQHKPVKRKKSQRKTHELAVFLDSIRAVFDDRIMTRANVAMQRLLQQKLREAPQYMRANRHRVRCHLPKKASWLIQKCPQVVGAAVEAFYYREPKQATSLCNQMRTFSPRPSVLQTVTMSRCQYAQLKQQHFFPPKPFRHLPGADVLMSSKSHDSPETRATEIGVKLACGLELLYASSDCDQFGSDWRAIIDEAVRSYTEEAVADEPAEPDDDDSWLYVHPDALEEKLQRAATRTTSQSAGSQNGVVGGAEELQNIATMFNNFMDGVSGVDGVEASEPVQLDMSSFLKLLQGESAKTSSHTPRDLDLDDKDWNDSEDDGDSENSSADSDDELEDESEEDEDRILREAMEEMDDELKDSTAGKTLTRVADSSIGQEVTATRGDLDQNDQPLDLDFHLLSNLLESMASQEGLAGPVSNILSELGTSR